MDQMLDETLKWLIELKESARDFDDEKPFNIDSQVLDHDKIIFLKDWKKLMVEEGVLYRKSVNNKIIRCFCSIKNAMP